jgi:peptidoglycan-associated lipoprotein
MINTRLTVLTSLLLVAGACSKKAEDTAVPEPEQTAPEPAVEEYPDKDPDKSSIVIDEKIAAICNIPTAHFDFDSSALSDEAKTALDALIACFTEGAAAENGMRLVGHADPRGTEEYNLALGQRRAGSVAGYLSTGGLGDDRVESSSRGELDAQGTDEESWALDRKVEIFLAE